MSGAPILEVTGLCAGYDGRTVLHDLDLTVAAGEVVCLLGANGAGKSTALGAMTGLVRATSGTVALDGEPLPLSSTHRIARAGVAHVPEDRSLFPSLTVRDHLRLADSRRARRRADEVDAVARVLDWFPALERLLSRRVGLLSGGEQQMVAIGRALMSNPRLLLCDEISLGLAPVVIRDIYAALPAIKAEGTAIVVVEQPVATAFGSLRNSIFLLGMLVILVGVLALGWAFRQARQFLRPLEALRVGATALGAGQLSYRIQSLGDDEMGELARTFNSMAEHLQETQAEIERRKGIMNALRQWSPPPALGVPPEVITEPFTVMLWGITSDSVKQWLGGS